jgi:hypothetical protein
LRECESVKETLRVSDDDVRAAGISQGDDIAAGVTVRYGGGVATKSDVVTVRAATIGSGRLRENYEDPKSLSR